MILPQSGRCPREGMGDLKATLRSARRHVPTFSRVVGLLLQSCPRWCECIEKGPEKPALSNFVENYSIILGSIVLSSKLPLTRSGRLGEA